MEMIAVSPAGNRDIQDVIEQKKDDNARAAARNGMHAVIGAAIWAGASILFPPAGIGGMIATAGVLYGSVFGWELVKNLGEENSLIRARKEAEEDPSFAKTAERAAAQRKRYDKANNVFLGAIAVTVASVLTMAIAPAGIAAAIAVPAFLASLGVGLGAGVVTNLAKGAYKAAEAVASIGSRIFLRKQVKALEEEAARLKGPAPVANAPSPTASFDKAANSNTPPAPEAPKEAPPVIKPEAPKL